MMSRSNTFWSICVVCVALAGSACTDPEVAKQRYLESGDKYVAEGKLPEAIVEYRNSIRQDPRFGQARWNLANALLATQNQQGAIREYIRAADLLPDNTEVQLMAARILLMARQFEDSKARADGVLEREPRNVDALILRANAMAGLRDVPGAIQEIEEALQLDLGDGRIYTSLGTLQLLQGERAEAEEAFKKAVEVSPQSIYARLGLANFYLAAGRAPEAERTLKESLAIDPDHVEANRLLAASYIATRRFREAEQPLVTAAKSSPGAIPKLTLADYYVQMERPAEAVPLLEQLASAPATYAAATMRLARIERLAQRRDAAYRKLDELIEKEPRNAAALTLKSDWQLEDRDLAGALTSARAATGADPASARAHFALGRAQLENRDRSAATASFTEVLRLNPRVVAAQILLSRLQLAQGNIDTATQLAQQARKAAPASPDAQLTLARSLIAKGDTTAAAPEVRSLLERYPQFAATHAINGMLLLRRNDLSGARAAFQRALERDPSSIDGLEGLLVIDARSKNLSAAVARIEERVDKMPDNAAILYVAARTYAAAGNAARTEQTLRRVIERDPDHLSAYLMLGRSYVARKRLDEALAEFDAAARRRPDEIGAATMAATILQMQNKHAEAQKRYEAIVAQSQRAPIAANNLAWMYAENGGNLDVALQLAQSSKSQMPDRPEVNDTLGWIYYKKNLPVLAIPPLEESVATDPNNASYRYHLGLAYAKAGQQDKARAALQRALQLNLPAGDAQGARRALAELQG